MDPHNQEHDLHLIMRIRSGDELAKEELVKKYIPLVKHIVRNHCMSFCEFEDLLQEGLIGLLNAIEQYKPEQYDVKFSSFAYICIVRKVYNVIKRNTSNKHRALNASISLQAYINSEETRTIMDTLSGSDALNPEQVVEEQVTKQAIDKVLESHLSFLEYTVIVLILRGYSLGEIERKIGVNAKTIDNARTRVKAKLKRLLDRYGSITSPSVPENVRRRKDLYFPLRLGG